MNWAYFVAGKVGKGILAKNVGIKIFSFLEKMEMSGKAVHWRVANFSKSKPFALTRISR